MSGNVTNIEGRGGAIYKEMCIVCFLVFLRDEESLLHPFIGILQFANPFINATSLFGCEMFRKWLIYHNKVTFVNCIMNLPF